MRDPEDYPLHDFSPFLIKFTEAFGIRYYGLAYVFGFLIGYWLLSRYHKRGLTPIGPQLQGDLFFALMLGVFIGGRLGFFLFYDLPGLMSNPLALFQIHKGGMASHGGFLGVAVALIVFARRKQQPLWHVSDLVCSIAPVGLFLGRVANFINGELWGRPAWVWWAWRFPDAPDGGQLPRHPSQLYEAGLEGLLMLAFVQWRLWMTPVLRESPGRLTGEFLFGYAVVRIAGEQFREPDIGIEPFLGLNRGALLSIAIAIAGLAIAAHAARRSAKLKP